MSNYIFYHLYTAPGPYKGNNKYVLPVRDGKVVTETDWKSRLLATYNKIKKAKLLDNVAEFIVNVNSLDGPNEMLPELEGVTYTFNNTDPGSERDTLYMLSKKARESDTKGAILYLHSKGVSKGPDKRIQNWIDYMEYFLIENWLLCLKRLQEYDTVGCNLSLNKKKLLHYSGNFWWANIEYLKQHHEIKVSSMRRYNRLYPEFWLLNEKGVKPYSMHNSNIDHYEEYYPREKYEVPQ